MRRRNKGLKSLDDLKHRVITGRNGNPVTWVTNFVCSKCSRRLNLRDGYTFYPKEQIVLCRMCENRRNPKPKKSSYQAFAENCNAWDSFSNREKNSLLSMAEL